VEQGWVCTGTKCVEVHGDGYRSKSEECDDSNTIDGDGCSAGGYVEHYFDCDEKDKTD